MAKDEIFVGVEIGTSKMAVAVGEAGRDGALRILGIGEAPSRGVRKGEVTDMEIAVACLRDAMADAEEKSEIELAVVDCLGIAGGHLGSFNHRGIVSIPEDQDEIDEADMERVRASAREVTLPAQGCLIHEILQQYIVDGHGEILNPAGMTGTRLEADYHIVHALRHRVQNAIRCAREVFEEVQDIAFSGYASAQAVLDYSHKEQGALVIDMGGGTTNFVGYVRGAVRVSGSLAVGGDHVTHDLAHGLRMPLSRAAALKEEEASVATGIALPGETVTLKDDVGFAGREIDRETLNAIVHARVRETLEIVRRKIEREGCYDYLGAGVYLTGGCTLLKGFRGLAEEVFELPVHVVRARDVAGVTTAFENPQYSTVIGLLKYAQAASAARPRRRWFPSLRGLFSGIRLW